MMIENAFTWGKSDKGTEKKSRGRPAQEEVEHADRRMGRDVAKLASARLEYSRKFSECPCEMSRFCLTTLRVI